ncbi:MAG: hypothetical protein ACRC8C_03095 [Mycoplasmoidaceae bacterium]
MRKNIKKLIIGLSIISVISTVTAITIPVVMHLSEDNNKFSNKDNTIQKVVVKKGGLANEILAATTEEEMRIKVEEFNKNNNWDSVFNFMNENNKILNNVVNEVIFYLDNKPEIPQCVFSFDYKEGIKSASGANIIRVNIENITLSVSEIDPVKLTAATEYLAGLLAGKDFATQKAIYDGWEKTVPPELENKIKDIVTFNDKQIDWITAVSGIKITVGKIEAGQPIPPIKIKINLNNRYVADLNKLLVEITELGDSPKIDATIAAGDATKLEAATKILNTILSGKDFASQKAIYDGWNNQPAPVGFEDAIKGIVTFKDGTKDLVWDDVVRDVTLTTSSSSALPLTKIPPVGIGINLKPEYKALSGIDLLKFDSADTLGNWNQISLTVSKIEDKAYAAKLEAATKVLADSLKPLDYAAQKALIDSWNSKPAPATFVDTIKDIVTFKDGTKDLVWDDVVKDVTLVTFRGNPGDKITIKININLKLEYKNISSPDLLEFNSADTLGNWNTRINLDVTKNVDYDTKLNTIKTALTTLLGNATDLAEQKKIYNDLAINTPNDVKTEIMDIVTFNDGTNPIDWIDAVEEIKIILNDTPTLLTGQPIPPIKIQIILNDKYDSTDKTNLTTEPVGLGIAK